jgi:hypothetical protein
MGYYKQQEIDRDVDRIVAWYGAHADLPVYIMNRILADKKLLDDVVEAWEARGAHPAYWTRRNRRRRETFVSPNRLTKTQTGLAIGVGVIWVAMLAIAIVGVTS